MYLSLIIVKNCCCFFVLQLTILTSTFNYLCTEYILPSTLVYAEKDFYRIELQKSCGKFFGLCYLFKFILIFKVFNANFFRLIVFTRGWFS